LATQERGEGQGECRYRSGDQGRDEMKISGWKMMPLNDQRKGRASDPIRVKSMVAYHNNRRVVLHRVEKVNPDGTREVFIIKASPKILSTDH
jgi:hypothetical protein